jgi:hypothetical protein
MALEIGRTTATIEGNAILMRGDKETVSLILTTASGDSIRATVWLTPKAMGMARGQLKVCGYDVDKQSLCELDADPNLLAGKTIPIEIEEYAGTLQAKVCTSEAPSNKRMKELDKALRDVKKDRAPINQSSDGDEDIPF